MDYLLNHVQDALENHRTFDVHNVKICNTLNVLLDFLPQLFKDIDDTLLHGALTRYFKKNHIKFQVVAEKTGPSGLTTYDMQNGMQIHLHQKAWVKHFPAMVGGNLCHRADTCLIHIFCHEFVHVLLFAIYLELNLSVQEVASSIASHYDHTHNVLFTTWLDRFFGHKTIDNSLLLHGIKGEEPLTFPRDLQDIETTCLRKRAGNNLRAFFQGKWHDVTLILPGPKKPHHSKVRDKATGKKFIMPNGLLRC